MSCLTGFASGLSWRNGSGFSFGVVHSGDLFAIIVVAAIIGMAGA